MRISDWSSDVCSSDLLVEANIAFGVGLIQNGVDLVETKLAARAVAPLAVSDDVAAVRCWRDDDGLQQAAVLDGRGQCINLGLVELPANLRGVWINVSERKRSEEHTSELQSLMRISYAVFCLKKKKQQNTSKRT